jgi:hypothetical protein
VRTRPENDAAPQLSNSIIEFRVADNFAWRIGHHRVADLLRMKTQRPLP